MASGEGFLTDGQREILKIASQNAENLSSSPKSPSSLLSEHHHVKAPASGKGQTAGIAVRHVRRSHSGKFVRVKKGEHSDALFLKGLYAICRLCLCLVYRFIL